MALKIYRVRAIAGKLVQHPGSIGTGTMHFIGHEKYADDKDVRYPDGKNAVPSTKYRPLADLTEVVRDSGDGYLEAKFASGCLDYVETCGAFDTAPGKGRVERRFAQMTRDHIEQRKHDAALVAALADAEDDRDFEPQPAA